MRSLLSTTVVFLVWVSGSAAFAGDIKLSKYPKVYTGDEGIQVTFIPIMPKGSKKALIEVSETPPISMLAVSEPALVVDTEGYEGPLDLLLHLARTQKVDLSRISVLALAEQYLSFVEKARQLRLELAADYLVMAAWLAYLKSRLLIPQQKNDDGPTGEEMATQLAFRLKRLEAMRDAATRLINRNRLGRDVFARGAPEPVVVERKSEFSATLYDLLNSYAQLRQRGSVRQVTIMRRRVWSLGEARVILKSIMGDLSEWTALDQFLVRYLSDPEERATAIASSSWRWCD